MATPSSRSTTRGAQRKNAGSKKGQDNTAGLNQVVDPSLIPLKLPPVWDEDEVRAEKWQARGNYEDPEGLVLIPESLQPSIAEWKRPGELVDKIGAAMMVYEKKEEKVTAKDAGKKDKRKTPEHEAGGASSPDQQWRPANSLAVCLASNHAYIPITSAYLALDSFKSIAFPDPGGFQQPWDLIYPKGKDGKATINPSGKYIVKLYAFGAWRKITMDDRFPISADGKILLPVSKNANEIWPMILTKAILKVANGFSLGITTAEPTLIPWLTGLVPSRQQLSTDERDLTDDITQTDSITVFQYPFNAENLSFVDPVDGQPIVIRAGEMYAFCGFRRDEVRNRNYIRLRGAYAKGPPLKRYETFDELDRRPISAATPPQTTSGQSRPVSEEAPDRGAPLDTELSNFSYFHMNQNDFLSCFEVMTMYLPAEKHHESVNDYWEDTTKVYRTKQPNLIYTNFEEPTVIKVLVTPAVERPGTHVIGCNFMLEEYDWATTMRKITHRSTTIRSNYYDLVIPEGPRVYQLSFESSRGYGYRLFCAHPFHHGDAGKILADFAGVFVHEINEEYPVIVEGVWSVLSRTQIRVRERALFSCQIIPFDEIMLPFMRLTIIDNDSLHETPCYLTKLPSIYLEPNQSGYSVVLDTKPPSTCPSGKYKLRFLSDLKNNMIVEPISSKVILDLEGQSQLNKFKELFRFSLKVKERAVLTLQLNCQRLSTNSSALTQFRVYEKGQEIRFRETRGPATVFNVVLNPPETKAGDDRQYIIEGKYVCEYPDVDPFSIHPSLSMVAASFIPSTQGLSGTGTPSGVKESKPEPASGTKQGGKSGANNPLNSSVMANNTTAGARSRPVTPNSRRAVPGNIHVEENAYDWRVRIISTSAVETKKDTERDDRLSAIKESWDKGGKLGRAAKGRAIREQFLMKVQQSTDQGIGEHIPPPQEPIVRLSEPDTDHLMNTQELQSKKANIKAIYDAYLIKKEANAQAREKERKERAEMMAQMDAEMAEWRSSVRAARQAEVEARELYRQKCAADREREKEAEAREATAAE